MDKRLHLLLEFQGTKQNLKSMYIFIGRIPGKTQDKVDGFPVKDCEELLVVGIAVCWSGKDAYYISLQEKPQEQTGKKVFIKRMSFRESHV